MGHSMGGLTALLAAGKQPVEAWVGLDPVGMNDSWLCVGKKLNTPCAVLRAEPGAWNMNGNARPLFAVLPEPKFTMKVRGSTHLDPESPTDVLGQLACGFADEKRRTVFERYALAFLKAHLLDDASAKQVLRDATKDSALTEVEVSLP
jgi:pimeloyl-ACP methyl ester carboxylesterase